MSRGPRAARYIQSRTYTTFEGSGGGVFFTGEYAEPQRQLFACAQPYVRGCGWSRGGLSSPPEVYMAQTSWQDVKRFTGSVSAKYDTGPTDAAAITQLIVGERQRVLFAEGFRAFDVERFNVRLTPAAGTQYRFGGVHGHTVCLPVPDVERAANPNVDPTKLISGVQGQFTVP